MGCHIKHANWRQQRRRNGKYKIDTKALNPQLWCINRMMEEVSLKIFTTSPYNTREHKQLVYSRKENKKRATTTRTNRVKPPSSLKTFELSKHSIDTIMAPPKIVEPGHTARSTRAQTRSRGPLEEREQPPEIIDIDEISLPEEILVESTPILEEISQPQIKAMEQDTPKIVHEP
jgi:hypothetical protein